MYLYILFGVVLLRRLVTLGGKWINRRKKGDGSLGSGSLHGMEPNWRRFVPLGIPEDQDRGG